MTPVSIDLIRFVNRMRDHGAFGKGDADPFGGTTDQAQQKERIRTLLLAHGLGTVIHGNRGTETYAEGFERFFGEPLDPNSKRRRNGGA